MIVVKMELWPFGSEPQARELDRVYIWNNGEGADGDGYTTYGVSKRNPGEKPEENRRKTVWVRHRRFDPVGVLVERAMYELVSEGLA